jgi:hypothetical protein
MVRDAAQEVGGGHSSDEGKDNRTCRSKGPLLEPSFYGRRDRVTAHKVQRTPKEKVRVLQRKLYRAAKAQPQRTFGVLYDKVCSLEVLWVAWEQVRRNHGAPGIDGETVEAIEAKGVEQFLCELQAELLEQRYRPQPARRVFIPKSDGRQRPLESVRKHQAGLQSFRSMRRIEASRRNASALRLRFSQSLASLRQRLSQAKVRSTTQRRGSTTNPLVRSERLTISVSS